MQVVVIGKAGKSHFPFIISHLVICRGGSGSGSSISNVNPPFSNEK